MYEDLEILTKLYVLQDLLTDADEIKIIAELISKRDIEIDIKCVSNYTKTDLGRVSSGVRKAYFEAIEYCASVYDIDVDCDFKEEAYEEFSIETEKMLTDFCILKLRIHREKNTQLSRITKEHFKTIMKDQFIKTILKYKNNDTN